MSNINPIMKMIGVSLELDNGDLYALANYLDRALEEWNPEANGAHPPARDHLDRVSDICKNLNGAINTQLSHTFGKSYADPEK